jgi:UDP-N-acetylglucosamine/UDP-N-acetylgalactosamine diphosphorylase
MIEEGKIIDLCERFGQRHIIEHLTGLSQEERYILMQNLSRIDFPFLHSLYSELKAKKKRLFNPSEIEPPQVVPYPTSKEQLEMHDRAKKLGESLLCERKVACLLVAGGQATRMGISSPKGFLPITPVKKKSFFQIFCEKILAISKRYNTEIPLLLMTNPESKKDIEEFFERQRFFGLKNENVIIFEQSTLPVLTEEGKIILKDRTEILLSPNGHGDSIKRIQELGILEMLIDRGYEYLFYFQVDNPLVKIADPVFLGYHVIHGADVSLKVVRKRDEDEKVGLYVKVSGKHRIIEYSDLDPEISKLRDENGDLIYWAGNTAMHVFSLAFLKRINSSGLSLPYHLAKKKVFLEREKKEVDVLKFETFVFDSLFWTERTCALEIKREEEFSPVKNRVGSSSPMTAQKEMSNLFKKWLRMCGIEVAEQAYVEISPLFALDMEECVEKLKGKKMIIREDTYIGEEE